MLYFHNIEYLNKRYGNDEKLEEEVKAMTKTLYDPAVAEKAKLEVAKKLISLGFTLEKIAEVIELPKEKIEKFLN